MKQCETVTRGIMQIGEASSSNQRRGQTPTPCRQKVQSIKVKTPGGKIKGKEKGHSVNAVQAVVYVKISLLKRLD